MHINWQTDNQYKNGPFLKILPTDFLIKFSVSSIAFSIHLCTSSLSSMSGSWSVSRTKYIKQCLCTKINQPIRHNIHVSEYHKKKRCVEELSVPSRTSYSIKYQHKSSTRSKLNLPSNDRQWPWQCSFSYSCGQPVYETPPRLPNLMKLKLYCGYKYTMLS